MIGCSEQEEKLRVLQDISNKITTFFSFYMRLCGFIIASISLGKSCYCLIAIGDILKDVVEIAR